MSKNENKHTGLPTVNTVGKSSEPSRPNSQEDGENAAANPAPLRKESTKQCPKCGNVQLLLVRTMNYKFCSDCNLTIPWYLDEGQAPLL